MTQLNYSMTMTQARKFAEAVSKDSKKPHTGNPMTWYIVRDEISLGRYIVIDELDADNGCYRQNELIEAFLGGQYTN